MSASGGSLSGVLGQSAYYAIMRTAKLIGKKVLLCPFQKKDAFVFHKWICDLKVSQFLVMHNRIMTIEDEKRYVNKIIKEQKKTFTQRENISLTIITKKLQKLIGNVGLKNIDYTHRKASIGIMIGDKNYWGKGYGSESLKLMCDFAFNILNLNSLHLSVYAFNKRAIICYKKAGFKIAGKLRKAKFINGKYWDEIFMDSLASEFNKKN